MDAHNYDPDSAECQACPERAACARVHAARQHPRAEVIVRMVQDAIADHADEHNFDVSPVSVAALAYHSRSRSRSRSWKSRKAPIRPLAWRSRPPR